MTKISTPMKPPFILLRKAWKITTERIASATQTIDIGAVGRMALCSGAGLETRTALDGCSA